MSSSQNYENELKDILNKIKLEEENINNILKEIMNQNNIEFETISFYSEIIPSSSAGGIVASPTYSPEPEEDSTINSDVTTPIVTFTSELVDINQVFDGTISRDGYEYNTSSHILKTPDGGTIKVFYYVPKNAINSDGDISSDLNTITVMGGAREEMFQGMNDLESSSLVICPVKKEVGENETLYSDLPVAATTLFGEKLTNNPNSSNTIMGCSNGGAGAITTAARNLNIYQNVVIFNYEPLCDGYNHGKGKGSALLKEDDILALAKQNISITFANCNNDPNMDTFSAAYIDSLDCICKTVNKSNEPINFKINVTTNSTTSPILNQLKNLAENNSSYLSFSDDLSGFLGVDTNKFNSHDAYTKMAQCYINK